MTREDLMIHDLVYISSLKRPLQVEEIRTDSIMVKGYNDSDDLMEISYYDVEPLDLTLDIIELNGWTQSFTPLAPGSNCHAWCFPDTPFLRLIADPTGVLWAGYAEIQVHYVHQLQHLASLGGVNAQTFKLH